MYEEILEAFKQIKNGNGNMSTFVTRFGVTLDIMWSKLSVTGMFKYNVVKSAVVAITNMVCSEMLDATPTFNKTDNITQTLKKVYSFISSKSIYVLDKDYSSLSSYGKDQKKMSFTDAVMALIIDNIISYLGLKDNGVEVNNMDVNNYLQTQQQLQILNQQQGGQS